MKKDYFKAVFLILLFLVGIGIGIWQISTYINADIPLWLKLKLLFG